jgi:peptide/nickel transport system permease protein
MAGLPGPVAGPRGSMVRFLVRRLGMGLATLVVSSFLVFAVMEFSPGDVARKSLGEYATQAQVDHLHRRLKLGDPLLVRYGRWMGVLLGVLRDPLQDPALELGFSDPRGARYLGNFGYSTLYKAPVNDIIWDRLGNTVVLAGIAFAVIVPLSLAIGVLAGMHEGSPLDRGLSLTSITLTSVPEFASGVFLMAVFVVWLGLLPGTSPIRPMPDWTIAQQLILPVAVLVLYDFGYVARMVRGAMVEVMTRPYIRTALLKGLPWRAVVIEHALRNAMIVPFTVMLLQVNWLITGVVVTESLFAYPGFGRMLLEAALFGDIALLEAATLVALTTAVTTQLAGDVGYMLLNPRIRVT